MRKTAFATRDQKGDDGDDRHSDSFDDEPGRGCHECRGCRGNAVPAAHLAEGLEIDWLSTIHDDVANAADAFLNDPDTFFIRGPDGLRIPGEAGPRDRRSRKVSE